MAIHYSNQVTRVDQSPAAPSHVQANEWGGRLRVAYWFFKTPSTGVAVNDVIELVKVPKGARILAIYLANGAMSTGAGTALVHVGDYEAPQRFATSHSIDATRAEFMPLRHDTVFPPTLGLGYEYQAETTITATADGEAWAANVPFLGFIIYAVD